MDEEQIRELYEIFRATVRIFENNAFIKRRFDGLICLSNPDYDLYQERYDPTVKKNLPEDSDAWGYLQDCLLRYMDGTKTVLDIAERHSLPFDRVHSYLRQFEQKGLVEFEFAPVSRQPVTKVTAS